MSKKHDFEKTLQLFKNSLANHHASFNAHSQAQLKLRAEAMTKLLEEFKEHYVKQIKTKESLKKCFFGLTMGSLAFVLIGCVVLICYLLPIDDSLEAFAGVITALVGGITSLLAIPKIIADYLFNKNEEQSIKEIFIEIAKADAPERCNALDAERKKDIDDTRDSLKDALTKQSPKENQISPPAK